MTLLIDLIGQRFGRLLVLRRSELIAPRVHWECRCDCGRVCAVSGWLLKSGQSQSCGCLHRELLAARSRTHGMAGGIRSPEYEAWCNAKARCFNPKNTVYRHYGGRGITMCAAWKDSFETFLRDMGPRPPGMEIDRIEVDGNYEPGNCQWVTRSAQMNNIRDNRRLTFHGRTMTLIEWARVLGLKRQALSQRLRRGWPLERALVGPAHGVE